MTRTILILLIGFLSSIVAGCSDTNLTHDIPLVPRPAQIVPGSGNYLFSGKTVICVENVEQAEESLRNLLKLKFTILCPAHGEPEKRKNVRWEEKAI